MAIPYDTLRLSDLPFYWSGAVVPACIAGEWYSMQYNDVQDSSGYTVDPDDPEQRGNGLTLQQATEDGFTIGWRRTSWTQPNGLPNEQARIFTSPLEPFDNPDWITYRPMLGYFKYKTMATGVIRLVWLEHHTIRRRHKGIQSSECAIRQVRSSGHTRVGDDDIPSIASLWCLRANDSGYTPDKQKVTAGDVLAMLGSNRRSVRFDAHVYSPILAVRYDRRQASANVCVNGRSLCVLRVTDGKVINTITPRDKLEEAAVELYCDLEDTTNG